MGIYSLAVVICGHPLPFGQPVVSWLGFGWLYFSFPLNLNPVITSLGHCLFVKPVVFVCSHFKCSCIHVYLLTYKSEIVQLIQQTFFLFVAAQRLALCY